MLTRSIAKLKLLQNRYGQVQIKRARNNFKLVVNFTNKR